MKSKDVRRRSASDLHEEVKRLEKQVFDSRFKGQTEEKTDRGLVKRVRRDVARIHTILRERELGKSAEPAASSKAAATKERE